MDEEKHHEDIIEDVVERLSPITGQVMTQATTAEEDSVIRKLDFRVLPLLMAIYTFSCLDRSNLGNARLAGLTESINLEGNRYDWLGTTFYIGCK